jgi:hypothetical protein
MKEKREKRQQNRAVWSDLAILAGATSAVIALTGIVNWVVLWWVDHRSKSNRPRRSPSAP